MKSLFALFGPEGRMDEASPEEQKAVMDVWYAYGQELSDAGAFIAGEGLQPSATAKSVQAGDDPIVSDGPFAETKEQLGGFYLIDCKDEAEAIEWAKKVPLGEGGTVEVRPVMDFSEFGYEFPQSTAEA